MKKLFIILVLLLTENLFGQYQMPVYTVTAYRNAQPGSEVGYAIDGYDSTMYHSNWNFNAIPDTLSFYFTANVPSITSLEYTPRQSGTNGIWKSVDIFYSTRENPTQFIKANTSVIIWAVNNSKKTFTFTDKIIHPYCVKAAVSNASYDGNYTNSSCAEMRFYSTEAVTNTTSDCEISTYPDNIPDTLITITSGTASSYNPGNNINLSYDGKLSTIYHSNYAGGGFPITLTYTLSTSTNKIDYLEYYPRSDGNGNGYFGNVTISYTTQTNSNFQTLMTYNFAQNGQPTIVYFPTPIIKPANIRITIADGYNNFASCAEMQFYSSSKNTNAYSNIFSDTLHSALQQGITQSSIDTISQPFYKSLAQCIFNDTYNKKYRVKSVSVLPNVNTTSAKLKISTYDQYQYPTGIYFDSTSNVVIFAQNIKGGSPALVIKDFANEKNLTESRYILKNGLNIINAANKGLGYISYYNDDSTLQPISINIVTGKINGLFDVNTSSNNDWIDVLSNNTYSKLDIVGNYIHLNFDKQALKSTTPFDGLGLIKMYDSIVYTEFVQQGLVKYNRVPKNRMFAYTQSTGGWYAGGLGAHYDLTWGLPNATSPSGLDFWGVAHELGHINQVRPGFRWTGTTEVSNNLYSAWVYYTMNRQNLKYTRLETDTPDSSGAYNQMQGGRINEAIDNTFVRKRNFNSLSDVFQKLVPFWQLELYYQVAGAGRGAPALTLDNTNAGGYSGVDYAHWQATVDEKIRNTDETNLTNGQLIMNFVKNTCDAVQEDLTDYFIKSGFLIPMNQTVDDYTPANITITNEDITNTINYVKSKNYSEPIATAINYISANSVNIFKNKTSLSGNTGIGASYDSATNLVTVNTGDWQGAVAYETYTNDSLISVSILGTGDVSTATSKVYYPAAATRIMAVGYDGTRIQVYPASTVPVKFISVVAANAPGNNLRNIISWKIGYEENIKNYEIQRSSNGHDFITLGNSKPTNASSYSFLDTIPSSLSGQEVYYRINAIDFDGDIETSNVASIKNANQNSIKLMPNPFNAYLTVNSNEKSVSTIQLSSVSGQIISTQKLPATGIVTFNTSKLPIGVYFVLLKNNNNTIIETIKALKVK